MKNILRMMPFKLRSITESIDTLPFGGLKIDRTQIITITEHSFAFVNIKPFAPGHTLVCPLRVTPVSDFCLC